MTQVSDLGPRLPADLLENLQRPFSHLDIQLRAGEPQEKEGKWFCRAIPSVSRWCYEARLHLVAPGAWSTFSPSLVVADDHLTMSVQVKIGPISHTSYGEMRIPHLAVPDTLGEIVVSAPDAYSAVFIDACQRFGLGRYLRQLPRRWVPYDTGRQIMKMTREEQRRLIEELYQEAGLPLDLPATQLRIIGRAEEGSKDDAGSRGREQAGAQPESLDDARARKRARDLERVRKQGGEQTVQRLCAKHRLARLEDMTDAKLAEVIQWLDQRQAS